jgi:hypothetical protein
MRAAACIGAPHPVRQRARRMGCSDMGAYTAEAVAERRMLGTWIKAMRQLAQEVA